MRTKQFLQVNVSCNLQKKLLLIFYIRRLRGIKEGGSKYTLDLETLQAGDDSVEAKLINTEADVPFKLSLTAISGDIFRLQIDEANPLYPRYRPRNALKGEPQVTK